MLFWMLIRLSLFWGDETSRFLVMKKSYTLLIPGLLLSACATSYESPYFYNEILIINNSREMIQDVSIHAGESGRMFGCGNIAPRGVCSDKFSRRRYMKSSIKITWTFGSIVRQTDEFVLEVPATFNSEHTKCNGIGGRVYRMGGRHAAHTARQESSLIYIYF